MSSVLLGRRWSTVLDRILIFVLASSLVGFSSIIYSAFTSFPALTSASVSSFLPTGNFQQASKYTFSNCILPLLSIMQPGNVNRRECPLWILWQLRVCCLISILFSRLGGCPRCQSTDQIQSQMIFIIVLHHSGLLRLTWRASMSLHSCEALPKLDQQRKLLAQ